MHKEWGVYSLGEGIMNRQLLAVQKHSSLTSEWLCQLLMFQQPMYLGLVFFTDIPYHKRGTSFIPCTSLFLPPSHLLIPYVSRYRNWTLSMLYLLQPSEDLYQRIYMTTVFKSNFFLMTELIFHVTGSLTACSLFQTGFESVAHPVLLESEGTFMIWFFKTET